MPVTTSYPGIYIQELPSTARTVAAAPTSIAVFIGYTHPYKTKTPNKPVRIFSFADYERQFGGLYRNEHVDNQVAYAVQQFFLNGGADAYVVGLVPKIHKPTPPTVADFPYIVATIDANWTLRAREPADGPMPMTATISNVQNGGLRVDITISYGTRVETFRGVVLDESTSPDYVVKVLARSELVELVPNAPYGPWTEQQATFDYETAIAPDATTYASSDFNDVFAEGGGLDKVDIFNILVIPGLADADVWGPAQAFCERKRAFLIMDAPESYTVDALVQQPEMLDVVPRSPNAAIYLPYLQTGDPLTGGTIQLPPSGYVAGIFARTDTNRGVWKAPAGLETTVKGTSGVVVDGRMTDMQAGVLNESAVNALRTFPGVGTVVFGARTTVAPNPAYQPWKYVPVRRMALFIEQTLYRNLGWVVFEPNDEPLWGAIRGSIERFMLSLFKQGAFQGSKPSDAFLVKCDSSTTTQDDIDNGKVNILVGFRPLKPAEFVVVQIAQLAGQVQA